MVARIKRGSHLSRTLNYNEQKVKHGGAECINAVGYPKDLDQLSFYDKLHRLEHQAALNERITANSVHISLNFADADKLDQEKLKTIADTYMQMIGFGKQPYLVYEHKDAGHQHIHIVTTNIRADGSKIEMNNIGRNQSEKARKTIEVLYGLTKAEQEKQTHSHEQKPDHFGPPRVQYGKSSTKQAISNVLEYVTREYKFTSLGELNAILQLYNVAADPGEKDSRLRQHKGLLYRVLDENGNKIGTPIKASAFWHKPTLANLEKKYAKNEILRVQHKKHIKVNIDWALRNGKLTLEELKQTLARERIQMVVQRTEEGKAYGVTFVDFRSKSAFKGSDLGKEYSAKGLEQRCRTSQEETETFKQRQKIRPAIRQRQTPSSGQGTRSAPSLPFPSSSHDMGRPLSPSILEILLKPIPGQDDAAPYELTHDMKKKKKRKPRL
jgi:hypothetical protein